jgi:hypothetical protein
MSAVATGEPEVYWIVYVTSPGTPDGVTQVERRFEFRGEDAGIRGWNCYKTAEEHGLTVRAEKVRAWTEVASRPLSR